MRQNDLAILDEIALDELEAELDKHTREIVEPDRWMAFSWSASRHAMFDRCKRQYYLNYYGARRVREAKSKVVSAVWWLKQVASLKAWIGTTIHHVAGSAVRAIRDQKPINEARLPDEALRYYQEGVRASERGAKHDNQWIMLFEHVYPGEAELDRSAAEMAVYDTAQTFLESDAYGFIKSVPPNAIAEVDEPFQSFEYPLPGHEPIPVYAIPDVLLNHQGNIYMIDWKTGDVAREGIRQQAGVYQLYVARKYEISAANIHMAISELGGVGESFEPPGGMPSLKETSTFIQQSIEAMLGRLEDAAHNSAAIKDFPMTDDRSICQGCGFKRACWRHK